MAKYITKFDSVEAYNAAKESLDYPNISLIEGVGLDWQETAPPTPPHDYGNDYFTFVALEDGTFSFSNSGLSYSLDSGITWVEFVVEAEAPTVQSGNTIMWKGNMTPTSNGIGTFSSTGEFDVEGNAMSLLFGDNFSGQTSLSGKDWAFSSLFRWCENLINAENLVLPATTLSEHCYQMMFIGCENLISAPELPATTLADNCYQFMFKACSSLTTAPQLPATTLEHGCYQMMFIWCTSLTTAPELPATTLANSCYESMFEGCSSLTEAPILPATTLADNCYQFMFKACSSLTTAPQLPATTLAEGCYESMFEGCTSLTTAPQLPATTLADYCYSNMFYNCTSLSAVTCLATDISASYCTDNWFRYVSSSGTFTKDASMNDWTSGADGIPSSWSVQNYTT